MSNLDNIRNIILFLGSNIGNFHLDESEEFMRKLASKMEIDDMLLLGVICGTRWKQGVLISATDR